MSDAKLLPGRSKDLKYLGSRWLKEPPQLSLDASDILPPGEAESTPLGCHYVIRVTHPHDYFHGKVRLNRLSSPDLQAFMALMHAPGTVPPRDRIIFLDTETTGIQSGAGICPFLVGSAIFSATNFTSFSSSSATSMKSLPCSMRSAN